jgi:hypothetical protein
MPIEHASVRVVHKPWRVSDRAAPEVQQFTGLAKART